MRDRWDKFDIVAKFVSSVALVAIPIVIGYYADRIKQSLERAKLVESLIAELTDDEKQKRRDLALLALESASPAQQQCSFLGLIGCHQDEMTPDLVIEVAKVVYQGTSSERESRTAWKIYKRRTGKTEEEVISDLSEGKRPISQPDPQATPAQNEVERKATAAETIASQVTSPETQTRENKWSDVRLVFIQYRSDPDKARRVQQALRQNGILAPGIERVPGIKQNDIRYSGVDDREAAGNLRIYLANSLNISIDPQNLVDLSSRYKVPPGQFEIWLKD